MKKIGFALLTAGCILSMRPFGAISIVADKSCSQIVLPVGVTCEDVDSTDGLSIEKGVVLGK